MYKVPVAGLLGKGNKKDFFKNDSLNIASVTGHLNV